jgi:hypothetical protein
VVRTFLTGRDQCTHSSALATASSCFAAVRIHRQTSHRARGECRIGMSRPVLTNSGRIGARTLAGNSVREIIRVYDQENRDRRPADGGAPKAAKRTDCIRSVADVANYPDCSSPASRDIAQHPEARDLRICEPPPRSTDGFGREVGDDERPMNIRLLIAASVAFVSGAAALLAQN